MSTKRGEAGTIYQAVRQRAHMSRRCIVRQHGPRDSNRQQIRDDNRCSTRPLLLWTTSTIKSARDGEVLDGSSVECGEEEEPRQSFMSTIEKESSTGQEDVYLGIPVQHLKFNNMTDLYCFYSAVALSFTCCSDQQNQTTSKRLKCMPRLELLSTIPTTSAICSQPTCADMFRTWFRTSFRPRVQRATPVPS